MNELQCIVMPCILILVCAVLSICAYALGFVQGRYQGTKEGLDSGRRIWGPKENAHE